MIIVKSILNIMKLENTFGSMHLLPKKSIQCLDGYDIISQYAKFCSKIEKDKLGKEAYQVNKQHRYQVNKQHRTININFLLDIKSLT